MTFLPDCEGVSLYLALIGTVVGFSDPCYAATAAAKADSVWNKIEDFLHTKLKLPSHEINLKRTIERARPLPVVLSGTAILKYLISRFMLHITHSDLHLPKLTIRPPLLNFIVGIRLPIA